MSHYFCVDHGYFGHIKTRRLIRKEGEIAALVPIKLWCYASVSQADGDFTGYSLEEIVEIVDLENVHRVKVILQAMRDVGFFDKGTWKLHDFEEYNAYATRRKLAAKKAAIARWRDHKSTQEALNNGAGEKEKAPPPEGSGGESSPPLNSPRPRDSVRRSGTKGEDNRSERFDKRKISASKAGQPSATARAFSIRKLLADHVGRPDSAHRFASKDEETFAKAEYRSLKKTLDTLDKEIALTPHKVTKSPIPD